MARVSPSPSKSKPEPLQFFVRTISGGALVLRADSDDPVLSVLTQIWRRTGIPVVEQRLIYSGRQLEESKKLREYSIQNDSTLHLAGRIRSTRCPKAWRVVDDMVLWVRWLCRGESLEKYKAEVGLKVEKFLDLVTVEEKKEEEHDYSNIYSHFRFCEIFIDSGAPAALVLLFLSRFGGNKECAVEAIRQLIAPNIDKFPKRKRFGCFPIVLAFCKLLRGNDPEDSLYSACRRTLGSLVNNIGFFEFEKPGAVIRELSPFVRELGIQVIADIEFSLSVGLCNYKGGSRADNVRDFVSLLRPLSMTIEGQVRRAIKDAIDPGNPCYVEEVKSMFDMLFELLNKINQSLVQVENTMISKGAAQGSKKLPISWDLYIPIMKELNSMGELYKNVKDVIRDRWLSINYLIRQIKQNGGFDDHRWLLDFRDVMDSESRRHLVMMMFPGVDYEYGEQHEMLIDRSSLLDNSFAYITRASRRSFRSGISVEFKNEEAEGRGVIREWFYLVCQALFEPQCPLFLACPVDRRRFYPNAASKVDHWHLAYFSFCGRFIALALMNKVHVGITFDRVFFLQLAGKPISLEDVRDADPYVYMSCKRILEMDADFVDSDSLGLTFVQEIEEFGSRTVVELKHGGKNIVVNSKNREEYVNLLIQHRFVTSISEQVTLFAYGFADILEDSNHQRLFFQSLELEDFDRMLCGNDSICVKEWRAHTDYNGYRETDPQICRFWKVIESMSTEQQRSLLFFWTSVKYLPVAGFGGLESRLLISRASSANGRLPSSQTCFYTLSLPPYSSLDATRKFLHFITQEHVSRSFGNL